MELVIFIGLQGAGKSTYYARNFSSTHQLVSKDMYPRSARNKQQRQEREIVAALECGQSVVVDNTNPARSDREPLIALARRCGAAVAGYYFRSVLADCLARNAQRQGRERVPDKVLFAFARRLRPPSYDEGFDRLFYVHQAEDGSFTTERWEEEPYGSG